MSRVTFTAQRFLHKRLSRMVQRGMLVQPAPGLFALPE